MNLDFIGADLARDDRRLRGDLVEVVRHGLQNANYLPFKRAHVVDSGMHAESRRAAKVFDELA
jgi:hypothetical protein